MIDGQFLPLEEAPRQSIMDRTGTRVVELGASFTGAAGERIQSAIASQVPPFGQTPQAAPDSGSCLALLGSDGVPGGLDACGSVGRFHCASHQRVENSYHGFPQAKYPLQGGL